MMEVRERYVPSSPVKDNPSLSSFSEVLVHGLIRLENLCNILMVNKFSSFCHPCR